MWPLPGICFCWPWPKMNRRSGLATWERRFLKHHHLRFQEHLLVLCPHALDPTSPSAGTLKAIQESWGNQKISNSALFCNNFNHRVVCACFFQKHVSISLVISHCMTYSEAPWYIVLGHKVKGVLQSVFSLSPPGGYNVLQSDTWPAVCLLCCSRAQSSLQAADTTSSTCWQELLQKVLFLFFRLLVFRNKLVYLLIVLLGISNTRNFLTGWLVGWLTPGLFPVDTWILIVSKRH